MFNSFDANLVSSGLPTECWDDISLHVHDPVCFTAAQSFGQIGLLSDASDVQAVVDTGASMTITSQRSDFISYQSMGGHVLKGITQGAAIAGVGMVHWQVEVNGRVVDLKLRALHVPESTDCLLCPQQLQQSLKLKKHSEISETSMVIHFDEGDCDCPYNSSNLPVITLSTPNAMKEQLAALNACVTKEANQNLTPPQKELLKWHYRLGHLGLQRVQALLRSGALGSHPLIKVAGSCERQMCSSW